jgi:hypothetical protein
VNFFLPEVAVKVIANGVALDPVTINLRNERSVAWDDYAGPLKFRAQ